MKLSIILPAFNEEKIIRRSLKAVTKAAHVLRERDWSFEIIVCDNNSTDRTAEIAREGGAQVVFEPVNQISRARNSGAAVATGDWLLFVDADSFPTPGLFSDMADAIQSGKVICGGAVIKLDHAKGVPVWIVGVWNLVSRVNKVMAGSFVFCEAAAFREVEGFSLKLFAAEELDLSMKLKKLGAKTGRKLVILTRHPLVTSARKMYLYSKREHLVFFMRTLIRGGRPLKKKDECVLWYDGRR